MAGFNDAPLVAFVATHVYWAALLANAVEAPGLPFPSRLVLVVAGALAPSTLAVALTVLAGAVGSVLADHVLYVAGRRGGSSVLAHVCRLTPVSPARIEKITAWFLRLGPIAVVLARFSTSARFFAAILSGSGRMGYRRFVACDVGGALLYTAVWVGAGHVFGPRVAVTLTWLGHWPSIVLIVPAVVVAAAAYRRLGRSAARTAGARRA